MTAVCVYTCQGSSATQPFGSAQAMTLIQANLHCSMLCTRCNGPLTLLGPVPVAWESSAHTVVSMGAILRSLPSCSEANGNMYTCFAVCPSLSDAARQAALPHLAKSKGNIVNMSSMMSQTYKTIQMAYNASKAMEDAVSICQRTLSPASLCVSLSQNGPSRPAVCSTVFVSSRAMLQEQCRC